MSADTTVSFIVEHLEVKDFRNYEWFLLELAKDLTVIVGPNATGKTNLIEALSLVTAGESFRKPRWADVIRRGAGQARVSLTASDGMRPLSVVLDIEEKRGRSYRLNGRARRSVSAATGTIPCVLFTPDDLTMVRGSSEMRRAPLDALGSQMSSTYDALRKQYHRILRQRNALLREAARQAEIEPWTESLVETGSRLIEHRRGLLDRIGAQMSAIHTELAEGDSVAVRYIPSWEREGGFTETLETGSLAEAVSNAANRERERGATITGPHRDDVEITLNGVPARVFASQGQQRTIVLAWKLAEVAVIEDVLKARPLLLLDDVMSELDEERRHALASRVKGAAQTVITTTNLHYFEEDELSSGRVVQLHEPEA